MNSVVDFEGVPLSLGDEVVCLTGPNSIQKGTVTGFKNLKLGDSVQVVITRSDGQTHTLEVASFLCAKR